VGRWADSGVDLWTSSSTFIPPCSPSPGCLSFFLVHDRQLLSGPLSLRCVNLVLLYPIGSSFFQSDSLFFIIWTSSNFRDSCPSLSTKLCSEARLTLVASTDTERQDETPVASRPHRNIQPSHFLTALTINRPSSIPYRRTESTKPHHHLAFCHNSNCKTVSLRLLHHLI
jgi:hypothetical protein